MASLQEHTGVLGHRLASHLLRRCTYSPTKQNIEAAALKTVAQAITDLFIVPSVSLDEPIDYKSNPPQKWINTGIDPTSGESGLRKIVASWWVHEAMKDNSISHKMELFLHQSWTISASAAQSRMFFDYLSLNRMYALGNLKTLAKKMTLDNSMLRYLNGDSNTEQNPNENYAREFLELFTIGKGPQIGPGNYTNYTEDDIVNAAKVLTGWVDTNRPLGSDPLYIDPDTNLQRSRPKFNKHDTTDKTFSSAFDNQTIFAAVDEADMGREIYDFVEMVFSKEETAKAYCRKLYRFFVNASISSEIETDIIEPLSVIMIDNDYELLPVLTKLFKSQHFYDLDDNDSTNEVIGALLKSPLELYTHTASFFSLPIPDPTIDPETHYDGWYKRVVTNVIFTSGGMPLFFPDSVAGYPAYYQAPNYSKNWFGGNTLIARYKIPEIYITGKRILLNGDTAGVQLDLVTFIRDSGLFSNPANSTILLQELTDFLLAETPTIERFGYFLNEVFLDNLSPFAWQFSWQDFLVTGDPDPVRIPLENLFTTLLSSQEFQCM